MHYGAMTLQDYGQVMALRAGQAGVSIRDADSPEPFARYLRRNPGLSFVARNGGAVRRAEYLQKRQPAGEGRMGCVSSA